MVDVGWKLQSLSWTKVTQARSPNIWLAEVLKCILGLYIGKHYFVFCNTKSTLPKKKWKSLHVFSFNLS